MHALVPARILACLTGLLSGQAPAAPDVAWTVQLDRGPSVALAIRLETSGEEDGESSLSVTQGWGGVDAAGADLDGLLAWGADGRLLESARPEPWRWTVRHAPGERLTVAYTIRANDNQADTDPRVHYRPILTERGMHLIGELALVRPERLDDGAPRRVSIDWRGFDQAGWELASSFGRGTARLEFELPLRSVRQGLFVAGEIELFEREVGGGALVVAIAGGPWGFPPERFVDLTAAVVGLERSFFAEDDPGRYLVSLLAVGSPDQRDHSLGGTGLHRAFATFTRPGIALEPGAPMHLPIVQLLLHEMFHEWNGHVLDREPPEELLYWFSEGFTSFYMRRLSLRGGWIDAAGYARELSGVLREYGTSPARGADAERVRELFWSDRDVQRLPYVQGDLLACLVDHGIRARSDGERSLDDFLRSLVGEARAAEAGRLMLSSDLLFERIAGWAGDGVARQVRAAVREGAPVLLPPDVFAPALRIEAVELLPFELGFDLAASRAAGVVRGLREGSAAHAAGLRDGERLAGASVWPGDPGRDVELVVGAPGEERRVVYRPAAAAVPGQRANLVDAASAAGLL